MCRFEVDFVEENFFFFQGKEGIQKGLATSGFDDCYKNKAENVGAIGGGGVCRRGLPPKETLGTGPARCLTDARS